MSGRKILAQDKDQGPVLTNRALPRSRYFFGNTSHCEIVGNLSLQPKP